MGRWMEPMEMAICMWNEGVERIQGGSSTDGRMIEGGLKKWMTDRQTKPEKEAL